MISGAAAKTRVEVHKAMNQDRMNNKYSDTIMGSHTCHLSLPVVLEACTVSVRPSK